MKIIKRFQGTIPENKIMDAYSKSNTDTYSCNYVNNLEEVIYEGTIMGGTTVNLDTTSYKRLLITCACYDATDANTGGASNILELDLTSSSSRLTKYVAGIIVPYYGSGFTNPSEGYFSCICEVSGDKKKFTPRFAFNGTLVNDAVNYYVSKIVGVK